MNSVPRRSNKFLNVTTDAILKIHFFYYCSREAWLRRIEREDLIDRFDVNIYICEKHFREVDLVHINDQKLLKSTGLPSLALSRVSVPVPVAKEQQRYADKSTQAAYSTTDNNTQTNIVPTTDASIQVKLETFASFKKKIHDAKMRLKTIKTGLEQNKRKSFQAACDRLLPPNLAELVKNQLNLNSSSRVTCYSLAQSIFSFNLSNISLRVYRMLDKNISLPGDMVLKRIYTSEMTTLSEELLGALKLKVNDMSEKEKYCTVLVDQARLKSNLSYNVQQDKIVGVHEIDGAQKPIPASSVLVVLVSGLLTNWMQPVGIAFLSVESAADISKWMDKVLAKLLGIGLKIKAYNPTFTSKFFNEAKVRNITVERPYFYIDDVKINFIFNVPHLMRDMRYNFLTHSFHFQKNGIECFAKCEFVKQFYEKDKTQKLRMAPKLTNAHVKAGRKCGVWLNPVRNAIQLLSKTVATGLATYIDFGEIDKSAQDTVDFIVLINDLFDLLNSTDASKAPPFSGKSEQMDVLHGAQIFFEFLQLTHLKTGIEPPVEDFVVPFQVTIASVIQLLQELQDEGFESFYTRRLTLDATEKLFKEIRSKADMNVVPTSQQFVVCFRRIFFSNILKPTVKGTIFSRDITRDLIMASRFTDNCPNENEREEPESDVDLKKITTSKFRSFLHAEKCKMKDVCLFLLKRCDENNQCERVTSYAQMIASGNLDDPELKDFFDNIWLMEEHFRNSFQEQGTVSGTSIYDRMKRSQWMPCPCYPATFIQKLFIRLRINMTMNYNNFLYRRMKYNAKTMVIPKLVA